LEVAHSADAEQEDKLPGHFELDGGGFIMDWIADSFQSH